MCVPPVDHMTSLGTTRVLFDLLFAVMFLISYGMSWLYKHQSFSLHSMYRNRLVRAYLGASNHERKPNLFTGFDPKDNKRMSGLWPRVNTGDGETTPGSRKLFHIINITWNMVKGRELKWQNRKAATFTISPLHAGNYLRIRVRLIMEKKTWAISLAPLDYSGAPRVDLGYYSSTSAASDDTFHARGLVLGNPSQGTYKDPGPR